MKTLITITGPSGSGKTTLSERLVKQPGFKNVITHTTRPKRVGEIEGKNYHFVGREVFNSMVKNGEFIEHIDFNDKSYGASVAEVQGIIDSGNTPVLVIEPKGLKKMSEYCKYADIKLIPVYLSGELETLFRRILIRDVIGITPSPSLIDYVPKRMASLVQELSDWGWGATYKYVFRKYDHETEDMIMETILWELK